MMKKYSLIAVGGTFDRLHRGHRDFLSFAFDLSENLVLGLTSDKYIETYKNGRGVEPYEIRRKNLETYLKSMGALNRVEIVPIDDHFGPTVTDLYPFEAIAVTEETKNGGEEINKNRKENNLDPLKIEVFPMTLELHGEPTSSSSIREGIFILPFALRPLLQDPWGEVIEQIPENLDSSRMVTVGDVTTKSFLDHNIHPILSIIDLKIERIHPVKNIQELGFGDNERVVKVKNPAATLTPELVRAITVAFGKDSKSIIEVDGEEDLAVLPVLIQAPTGFTVFYGQPGQGMVKVEVTDEIKKKAQDLLNRFDKGSSV